MSLAEAETMKALLIFPVLIVLSMITSCSGIFPFAETRAPRSIVGYKMDASGMEGSYHYEFFEDQTYKRTKIFPSGKESPVEKGSWKWEKISNDLAVLTLDQSMVVKLHFTTSHHANATIPTSERLFPVDFTKHGEE